MANPFDKAPKAVTEPSQLRREKVRIGVFAALATAVILIGGMLIQGCKGSQSSVGPGQEAASVAQADGGSALHSAEPDSNGSMPSADAGKAAMPAGAATNVAPAVVPPPVPPVAAPDQNESLSPPPAARAPAETTYVVRRGDTLSRIARAHATSVKALKASNGLAGDRIIVGQKLKLPQAVAAQAPVAQN
jgi:LysM repeat protein